MSIFLYFSIHIHCDVDWMLSVVEEMNFELAAINKKLAKPLNKARFSFFAGLLRPRGGSLVLRENRNTNFKIITAA